MWSSEMSGEMMALVLTAENDCPWRLHVRVLLLTQRPTLVQCWSLSGELGDDGS